MVSTRITGGPGSNAFRPGLRISEEILDYYLFGGQYAAFLSTFSSFWQGGIFYGILLAKLKMGVTAKMW